MQEHDPIHALEMIRIPGLYRSWELPELLESGRHYRIEGAGFHEDGNPLLAVYADEAGPPRCRRLARFRLEFVMHGLTGRWDSSASA